MKNIKIKPLIYKIRHQYLTANNVVLAIALMIAAGWAWGSLNMMTRNYQLQRELGDKKRQLALTQVDVDNKRLAQKYYKTDEFLELSARESLNLVKPGERMLILQPPSAEVQQKIDAEKSSSTARIEVNKDSNLDQWVNFLFGGSREAS